MKIFRTNGYGQIINFIKTVLQGRTIIYIKYKKMDLEDENNIKNVLSFKTDYFLPDSFDSPHAFAFFKINPSQINWNYTILSCFLNQFSILKKRKSNSYYTETDKDVYESPNEGSKIAEISPQQSYDSR